jgi:hypothetical protein
VPKRSGTGSEVTKRQSNKPSCCKKWGELYAYGRFLHEQCHGDVTSRAPREFEIVGNRFSFPLSNATIVLQACLPENVFETKNDWVAAICPNVHSSSQMDSEVKGHIYLNLVATSCHKASYRYKINQRYEQITLGFSVAMKHLKW